MRSILSGSWTRRALALGLPVLVAGVTLTSTARADEPSAQDIAQARDLAQQANAAFQAGNFVESEKLYYAATKLYSLAPTLTLGLARSQAKQGKFVAAQEGYNKVIREWDGKANASPAFKDALDAAKAEVGAVSAKLASVVISIEGQLPNGTQVTIDGTAVNLAALGLKRPVDPGPHLVKASADGYKTAEATFRAEEGTTSEAKLKLEKGAAIVAATEPPASANAGGTPANRDASPPPRADKASGGGSNKTLAIVAFGVGGAGLVLGSVTGLMALGKHSDLNDACKSGTCPADKQADVDSYKTMGTLSTVGFIVAGVGAAAGAVLLLTSGSGKVETGDRGKGRYATAKTAPSVVPYLGIGGGGVVGRF
jgi:hypothetical protein